MATQSITKFKINNNVYGFNYRFDGYIERQGYKCLDYIKFLKNAEKRKHFIDRISKIHFCDDDSLTYSRGNDFINFLLNSNDNTIELYGGWSSSKNEDGTYTNTTYQTTLDLASTEHNKVYNYTGTSEYTYLIDLDEDKFFVNNIEIPQEYWEEIKLLNFYNEARRASSILKLRFDETYCIMEEDIKQWFFDKYDNSCNIKDFVKEKFINDGTKWTDVEKIQKEILGNKLQDEKYFNQCILESHNMIINGLIHGRCFAFRFEITEYDYRYLAKTELSAEKILKKAMINAVFLNLFNKYYFSDLIK